MNRTLLKAHSTQPSKANSASTMKASAFPALKKNTQPPLKTKVVASTPTPTTLILVEDCSDNTSDCQSSLLNTSLTRKQFASIPIPPVGCINAHQISFIKCYGPFIETDPLSIAARPPETDIKRAGKEMRDDKKVLAVIIGNFGCFSKDGIHLLLKMCEVRRVELEIRGEQLWLNKNDGLSDVEKKCIQEVLWDCNRDQTLLKAGSKSIDLQSFVTLAEERYLDNFIIDTVICKVIELERLNGNETTLYLPSEMFSWLESSDNNFVCEKFSGVIGSANLTNCEIVLLPVHMNGSHWGLFVVDVTNQRFLFDDGLRINLDNHILASVKSALDMLLYVQPTAIPFQSRFWNSIQTYQRFGMPSQCMSAFAGEGSGSCGVGVVLSATDFVQKGLSIAGKFHWNFGQMRHLRKLLMLTILNWKSHNAV